MADKMWFAILLTIIAGAQIISVAGICVIVSNLEKLNRTRGERSHD